MSLRGTTQLNCFSPPVMLATFLIEIIFAGYVLWRYKMTTATRLVVGILIALAVFQGTEYMLCGGFGATAGVWSSIGYSSITLLPPLGLHLAYTIAGKQSKYLIPLAYITGAAFIAFFTFKTQAISGHTCYANYAVFDKAGSLGWLYALYYYGWLLIGTFTAYEFGKKAKTGIKQALYALSIGYISFIAPTTFVNLIDPTTIAGIPSIMCGFAVIFAFIITLKVAPETIKQNNNRSLLIKLPF